MKYFLSGMMLFCFGFHHAQNCDLTLLGELKDFHDGTPITAANIYIQHLDKYVISDLDGKFKIENLCQGNVTLVISHIGCETKTVTISMTGDVFKSISIEHHIEELNEVSVKGIRNVKTTETAQETVLKAKVLEQYSQLSLGDALREVSGVSSINTGSAIVKPIINGLHSSRILIMNNEVRLQDQEWGIEHAPNIDINSAEQISVIKGSGALAYGGDAIGGVIVLKPKRVILIDTLQGKTNLGVQSNGRGYFVNSSLSKNYKSGWYGQIQASYKRNGDFEAPDYNLTNTGVESRGLSARFGKKTFESGFDLYYSFVDNTIGILSAAHVGNIKNLANAINRPEPIIQDGFSYDIETPRQEVTHHLFKASYYQRFENFGKIDIQYDYQNNQRFEFDTRRGGRSVIPAIDLKLQTHTITANAKIDNNSERKYNFGIMTRYQNNFANPDTGVRRLIPDYDKYDFGIYATAEWNVNDNLVVDAGLRYDFNRIDALKFYRTSFWESRGYDIEFPELVIEELRNQVRTIPEFDYHNLSGAIGVKYSFNDNHYILGNYMLASRPPNPSELFSDGLHHSAARIEIGDLRIDSEQSHRISATYGYNSSKFNAQVESYYNQINDFIYLVPGPDGIIPLIRGPFPVWEYIQTDALLFGLDFSADYQMSSNWNFTHKSSFIKGYDRNTDLPLIDIPSFMTNNGIMYSNSKWYNFNTSLRSEWVFEQNEFPDEFNFTVPIANEDDIYVDLGPPPAYHLLHFQTEVKIPVFKQSNLNIRFSVDNILDTNYRNYLNRLRFFADDLGRNFRLQLQLNY